jgi:hypothetical protein
MKRPVKIAFLVAYCVLLLVLFKGIKAFEGWARQAYYSYVTRQMVASASKVPPDKCLLGIYKPELPYSFDPLTWLEDSLGSRFTLVSFYQAWGSLPEHQFQPRLMDEVVAHGRVPVLTWEPWVTGFTDARLKPLSQREHRYLKDIADGAYDFYIRDWARAAVTWGKPFFLRFAHEMTNSQYPWSPVNDNRPEDYIRAWWHVRGLFDTLGARNVIWVWCPYTAGSLAYYPGDKFVDWVAMDVFNYGDLQAENSGDVRWASFDRRASSIYQELSSLRKPIMVAEVGSTDMGGSRPVWYREMLTQVAANYPSIKALVIFDDPADRTSGRWLIDWSIEGSPEVMAEISAGCRDNHFVHIPDYGTILSKPRR